MFIFRSQIQIKLLWEDNWMNQTKWALKHGTTVNKSEKDNIKKKKKQLQLSKQTVTPKLKKKKKIPIF